MPTTYYYVDGVPIHTFYTGTTILPGTPLPKTQGKAVLFLHGAGSNGHVWVDMLQRLSSQHSPVAIDLPAHGRSGGLLAADSIEAYCAVVDAFLAVTQFTPCVLVGHSMGGAIAQLYALTHPGKLAGLVLSSTGARLRVAPAILQLWQDASMGKAVNVYGRSSYSDKTSMDIVRQGWGEQRKTDPRVRLGDFVACDRFDAMARLPEITVPTLVLGGTDDVITPPRYTAYLHQHISGAQLTMIPDAGHIGYAEQPEAMASALLAFLAQL
ncbi:MAG: alpha/beta hydrolase [Candidatus Tectomicrobia bacterium]|uniref:Alpha/beta hydrolase n=1 Tax=Tectimicrobiota bacterium TaxID=2528274 RepID=A0A938B2R1_UNCTE|nr:alpha/beta hydrolase [Candidatus Tectomicrobia bacterium]